ncbi:MAG: hypothetical protein LBM03_01650 [Erysipelotrichaceae bacterium]|jgi:M6 family metalloprotease-like protein|nr:hypothetical protein [Erysipelotrichaceae bacterium]
MRKRILLTTLLISVISLASCDLNNQLNVATLEVIDNNNYYVGQSYAKYGNPTIELEEKGSNSTLDINDTNLSLSCIDPNGKSFDINSGFNIPGEYKITAKYSNKINTTYSVNVKEGAYVPDELTFVNKDIQTNYAPALGNQKMLVIPIALKPGYAGSDSVSTWTEAKLKDLESYYFGESTNTKVSLKDYYTTASFGNLNIDGMVSDVYEETSSSLTVSSISGDLSYQTLFKLIENAVEWVEDNHSEIDWKEYDTNEDGCIDSIHLITNYNATDWNTPLWPHMYETGSIGTLDKPLANVYSISAINHVSNAITAIHEQGHIFGLQDYYDYSNNGTSIRDYVGGADMQSHNVFDWNSFSKLSTGWTKPIVIDGNKNETIINLRPASSTGDCLIVPTGNWNGSAFDEYILIELFTKVGNNVRDWSSWGNLARGGIRLYHVDARIYGYDGELSSGNGGVVDNVKQSSYEHFEVGANNSYDASAYASGAVPGFENFKLLTLIQEGGVDTFGSSSSYARHSLNQDDLFHTGDTFTFEAYKQFFLKNTKDVASTMDDGTIFPYTITFENVSDIGATIKVVKN